MTITDVRIRKIATEGKKKALDNIGLDISSLADVEYNYGERDKLIP